MFFNRIKFHVMKWSRRKKIDFFYSLYKEGSVLDVGVSNNEHNPAVNMLLNNFNEQGREYTGLGVQDLSFLMKKHPSKKFVNYPGGVFPFEDKEFDWVFSNAVIEHVGSRSQQLQFLNEMLRVGRNVFFTTPNKYFPIESHTNTLFRHWLAGDYFYDWCKKNKPYWNKDNLNLLGYSGLTELLEHSHAKTFKIYRNRIFGLVMTFTVVCNEIQY